jgi:hypothetical protein
MNLDPFVAGGPEARLPPDRFERSEGFGGAGGAGSYAKQHKVQDTNEEAEADVFTHIEDTRAG